MKHCMLGDHLVAVLWKAKTKTSPSACKNCYGRQNPSPIKKVAVRDANEPVKPKVGDIYQEKELTTDFNGAKYHKEFRIVSVKRTPKEEKTIGELIKLAVVVFHRWIKRRDDLNGYYCCISCNKIHPTITGHAGHFINAGNHSIVRFHELNVWLQCSGCNIHLNGNYWNYRDSLILKIGIEAVEDLEQLAKQPFKWDRQELLDIIKKYK